MPKFVSFSKNSLLQNNLSLKCQIGLKKYFHIKLLKTGFVANDKWRQAPGFDLLHHNWSGGPVDVFFEPQPKFFKSNECQHSEMDAVATWRCQVLDVR